VVSVSNITKIMGGVPLFEDAGFQVYAGKKIGLVGPNGAGKTTLFRLIVGELTPDAGTISIQGNTHIAYFSQQVRECACRGWARFTGSRRKKIRPRGVASSCDCGPKGGSSCCG